MRRLTLILVIAAALGGAAWWFAGPGTLAVADQPAWRTARADRGDLIASVNATGTINPISTVVVGSQVSGQVIQILADFNTQVSEGQVLARLDPTQVRARLDGARADLANIRAQRGVQAAQIEQIRADIARAEAARLDAVAKLAQVEAQLAEAERTLTRQTELGSRGVASQTQVDQARTAVVTQQASRESARAQIASAEASKRSIEAGLGVAQAQVVGVDAQILQREAMVRQIEVDLANTEVRSPVVGTVVQRQVELGQTVAASLQAPTLFLVAQDLRSMEIYANIDEADVGRVKPGQTVTFSVNAYPNRQFRGEVKLVRLGSQTIQNVVIYTAVISFPNPRMELLPGMTATLRIITDRRDGVLRVPNAALRWRPAGANPQPQPQAAPAAPFGAPPMAGRGFGPRGGGGGEGGGRAAGEFIEAIKTELKLEPEQAARVDGVVQDMRPQFRALFGPGLERAERLDQLRRLRAELVTRIEAILTAEQRQGLAAIRARYDGGRDQAGGQPGRVFVAGADGRPEAVTLSLGISDGVMTEVLSGDIEAGRELIVGGGPAGQASPSAPRGFRMF